MDTAQIINTIEGFIKFIELEMPEDSERDKQLLMHLDSLGLAQAYTVYEFDEKEYSEPEEIDYKRTRKMISEKFNNYGYYNLAEDLEAVGQDTKILIGDAIDDIVDIYKEIKEVNWRLKNTSTNDALWYFTNNYNFHWGEHLRNLQRYVYHKQI